MSEISRLAAGYRLHRASPPMPEYKANICFPAWPCQFFPAILTAQGHQKDHRVPLADLLAQNEAKQMSPGRVGGVGEIIVRPSGLKRYEHAPRKSLCARWAATARSPISMVFGIA